MAQTHGEHPRNRLAGETSPYLLQHQSNPVDWYPWGQEAIDRARAEDKPIFLSVGYSACHWCHVMERESFEDPAIAALMNEHFINVKVDREERPDIDQIYMAAVQALTGHGGWPMSVFLTPDLVPFFGGTYYPPVDSRGMAGFPRVLLGVEKAWRERRAEIVDSAGEMLRRLETSGQVPPSDGELTLRLLDGAAWALAKQFDPANGGFGSAPKFPHPMDLRVLLRHYGRTGDSQSLSMVRLTLLKMAYGGIYDHLGGGFARYSTDDRWLVPHFEKMLYDNALLASVYLEAYQVTREPEFARVARETLDYVLGRMTDSEGGLYSTEDADSEGVEGKFYVWSLAEIRETLGADRAAIFAQAYDVSEAGNWEHSNILNLPRALSDLARVLNRDEPGLLADLAEDRAKLLALRETRIPPAKDTKILTSWNGLMIAPLAEAGAILGEPRYVDAARRAAAFLLDRMRQPDGRLLHSYKDGQARFNGYLDDYANLIDGLTHLYEATGEPRWIAAAVDLSGQMIAEFHDDEAGGFFYTGKNHEALITRQKDAYDNATPSGNAMAATGLLRLAALTGRADLEALGRSTLQSIHTILEKVPMAAGQSMVALDFLLAPSREFAVFAGADPDEFRSVLAAIAARFLPHKVVAPASPQATAPADLVPLLARRAAREGKTTTYICERFTCQAPITGLEPLKAALVPTRP
ncbi:thioredoxin domain-containing protein [Isosphaeraceae bacterium EP7]